MFRTAVIVLAVVATVTSAQNNPCKKFKGVHTSRAKNDFCCDKKCGPVCGGKGCGSNPGGSRNCCPGPINSAGLYCNEDVQRAPCILRKTVPTAKPTKAVAKCAPAKMNWDCCNWIEPCGMNEGDCDADIDCNAGLVCSLDVGADYGVDSGFDVCQLPSTTPGSAINNPASTCDPRYNNWDCCADRANGGMTCQAGEGDCDLDSECDAGLICADNAGSRYGADAYMDICETPLTGAAKPQSPCPQWGAAYTAVASNTTATCLTFGASLCESRYVKVTMTGTDIGVPCGWEPNMGMCLPRLDCVHDEDVVGQMPTPKPTQDLINDFCPLFTAQFDCNAFLCTWDPIFNNCYMPGNEAPLPAGIEACPALKDEVSCMQWAPTLNCAWDRYLESCTWTECSDLTDWQCNNVNKCRFDTTLKVCMDKSKECFVDMNGLIADGTSVSNTKSICINSQNGCEFTSDNSGGWKCVPTACSSLGQGICNTVPWRCQSNGKKGKKFVCMETSL